MEKRRDVFRKVLGHFAEILSQILAQLKYDPLPPDPECRVKISNHSNVIAINCRSDYVPKEYGVQIAYQNLFDPREVGAARECETQLLVNINV